MDEDLYWAMEEAFGEWAIGGLDDEGLLAQLDYLSYCAIEVDNCDPAEVIEEMSRAAHNNNVGDAAGRLLGFVE